MRSDVMPCTPLQMAQVMANGSGRSTPGAAMASTRSTVSCRWLKAAAPATAGPSRSWSFLRSSLHMNSTR